jgi:hypothetical protein
MTTLDTPIHQWADAIIDPDTGSSIQFRHLIKSTKHEKAWKRSFSNELGCLIQGIRGGGKGTNTIYFITHLGWNARRSFAVIILLIPDRVSLH